MNTSGSMRVVTAGTLGATELSAGVPGAASGGQHLVLVVRRLPVGEDRLQLVH